MSDQPVAWGMPQPDGTIIDCITPEERDRMPGNYTVPLYARPQPALTVDALRVEFEKRYKGHIGATRLEGGAALYLSPAVEREWREFIKQYTQPKACPRCGKENPADVHTCTPPPGSELALILEQNAQLREQNRQLDVELAETGRENRQLLRQALDALTELWYSNSTTPAREKYNATVAEITKRLTGHG
jgi:hypothetical protein